MSPELDRYYSIAVDEQLHKSTQRLKTYLDAVFQGIDFKDTKVLDIGGGSGLFTFYAACKGAREVICLKPEADGSTAGVSERFERVRAKLNLSNAKLRAVMFQEFESQGKFDIILLHNSVNHLDEAACNHLLEDLETRALNGHRLRGSIS